MSKFPEFKGLVEGYVVNQLDGNYWRVQASMSRLEVLQEAYLVYHRIGQRYPDVEPRHFMSLFKTAWSRRFVDMAQKDTQLRRQVSSTPATDQRQDRADTVGELENDGYLAVLLRQAPAEVGLVMNLLLNAPSEIVQVALDNWQSGSRKKQAQGNQQVARWLGLPASAKPLDAVADYLGSK